MRVLVLGGTRFIGPYVVRALLEAGHSVGAFHRGVHDADLPKDVERLRGDRMALGESAEIVRKFQADAVVDMFAMLERDAISLTDVFGPSQRMIVASSIDVYRARDRVHKVDPGAPDPVPLGEDAPLRTKLFPYRDDPKEPWHRDYDKIPVEQHLMRTSRAVTILRLPLVFGPGDHRRRLHEYLQRMTDATPSIHIHPVHARWSISRGFVENVAHAFVLALGDRAAGRIYNVADEHAHPEADWIRSIARAAAWKGQVVPTTDLSPDQAKEAAESDWRQDWVVSTDRIRTELGFRDRVPFEEALRRTAEWERANPAS